MRWPVVTCPNPKCHRKIEEPVLLNNLSTTPAEHYYACPNCFFKLPPNRFFKLLAGLFVAVFGSITLAFVGWLTWYDMTTWGKDVALIFFGSRASEHISLGIGMKVIHYFLIGSALLMLGAGISLRRRSKATELHLSGTAPKKENLSARDVEVTLKLPKKLVDFLKVQEESKGTTVEEYLKDLVYVRVTADLNAVDEFVLTPNACASMREHQAKPDNLPTFNILEE